MHQSDISLLSHFSIIKDPRVDRTKKHKLIDILAIAVCSVVAFAEGFEDMEDFGREREEWLRTFLELPHGIPSHDTFERVFSRINPAEMQTAFIAWIESLQTELKGKVVAIDGKSVRRSFDRATNKAAIHMVSAWVSESNLLLGQIKTEEKSSEIKAIPELLNLLEVSGAIVSVDAIGCQKDIARTIVGKNAHYVLAVKKNQPNLHEDIEYIFSVAEERGFIHETHQTVDGGHGRVETRTYQTITDLTLVPHAEGWQGVQSVGRAHAIREVGDKKSEETRYYISTLDGSAKDFGRAVREHWGIENSLHWVLDVSFSEDQSRIRKDHAPENVAVLRRIALNLVKKEGSKGSLKRKRKRAAWNNDFLIKVLSGN